MTPINESSAPHQTPFRGGTQCRLFLLLILLTPHPSRAQESNATTDAQLETILQNVEASAAKIKSISLDYSTEYQSAFPNSRKLEDVRTGREAAAGTEWLFRTVTRTVQSFDLQGKPLPDERQTFFSLHQPKLIGSWAASWMNPGTIVEFDDPHAIPRGALDQADLMMSDNFAAYAFGSTPRAPTANPLRSMLTNPNLTCTITRVANGEVIIEQRYSKSELERRVTLDSLRGWTLRSIEFGLSGPHPMGRLAVDCEEVSPGSGQWCPRTIESWTYDSRSGALIEHWKTTITHVVVHDTIDENDFSFAQFGMPKGQCFARTTATGQEQTVYWDGEKFIDGDAAWKNGIMKLYSDLITRRAQRQQQLQAAKNSGH